MLRFKLKALFGVAKFFDGLCGRIAGLLHRSCIKYPAPWMAGFAVFSAAPLSAAELSQTNAIASPSRGEAHPLLTFGLDRIGILQVKVLHNPLWQYLASLIYMVLAFYAAKLLDYVVQFQLRKWASRTATKIDDLLLKLLHGPVKIVT